MNVSKAEYKGVKDIIASQIVNVNKFWRENSDKNASKKLEAFLLNNNLHHPGTMDINFDRNLLKLVKEVEIWTTYHFQIPSHVKALYNKIEPIMLLFRQMTKIVQNYNQIMTSLSTEERGLFKEKVRKIDRFIWMGKNQHTWMVAELKEWIFTVTDVTKSTFDDTLNYKNINSAVQKLCTEIENLEMIDIASTEIVSGDSFKSHQMNHIEEVKQDITNKYEKVKNSITKLKDSFTRSSTIVEDQWKKYADKIDEKVATAIRNGILSSLTRLAESISSSGKSGLAPMMRVTIQLKDSKVHVNPKLSTILDIFEITQTTLVNVAKNIVPNRDSWRNMITQIVEKNPEFQEIQQNIRNDITSTTTEITEYIKSWDVYKDTWELDSNELKRLYLETNPETHAFDSDVAKYKYLAKCCKKHEAIVWIGFILIDCIPLQEGVIQQCEKWQDTFMEMMRCMVKKDLNVIYKFAENSMKSLYDPPENVYDLKEALQFHGNIIKEIPSFETKFKVIWELTDIIQKYKKDLDKEDSSRLTGLDSYWERFREFIQNVGMNLQSFKEKSKEELLSKSHEFDRHVRNTVEEYTLSGPFAASWNVKEAFKQLELLSEKITSLAKSDKDVSEGLSIFSIPRPVSQDLIDLQTKLDMLSHVWNLAEEWEEVHSKWQNSRIVEVDKDEMQNNIDIMINRIHTFNEKDIDNRWEIFFQVKYQIQSYEKTKTLISLLVEESLRGRHWEDIFIIIRDVQPNVDEVNIEKESIRIIDLSNYGFDKCISSIEDVVHSAKKEIEIENALKDLANLVHESQIVTDINKQEFFIIKNISELFITYKEAHEDLRHLKLSKYISPFSLLVEELDKDISIILTLLEKLECSEKTVLEVKDLFSVFCIKKQLPAQYRLLTDTLEFWTDVISQIQTDPRIFKFTEQKALTAGLSDMIASLKDIRKQLGSFLIFRREQYPRLFILTDEEMLKLFSCKSCDDISAYMQKLFPNIAKVTGGTKRDGSLLVQKILTHDGEIINYQTDLREKETIENIIAKIEEIMTEHLKTQILLCLQALRKTTKLELVIREYSFQAYEVARRILITAEVTKVFETTTGNAQNAKLIEILKRIEENMEKISRLQNTATSAKLKLKLLNINSDEFDLKVSLVGMQRFQSRNKTENCQTLPEWFAFFKFYHNKHKNEITVLHGYQTHIYGFENRKMEEPIVQYPFIHDTFLDFSCASKAKKCVFLRGQNGDGKSSAIQAYANMTGKYLMKFQIDSRIEKSDTEKLFKILDSQTYMIHILKRNFDFQLLSSLSTQIDLHKKSVESKSLHLFITYHSMDFQQIDIVGDLRKSFRPIFFQEELKERLIDSKLVVDSFSNFELLRARMRIIMRGFNGVFFETGSYINNRDIFETINTAISLIKEDKNMLQEESILQSFWICFNKTARYELSFPLHKAVKDLYPRLEIKMMLKKKNEEIIERAKSFLYDNNFPVTDNIVEKIYEIWEKLENSDCLVVVGQSNILKSFIINAAIQIQKQPNTNIAKFSLNSEFYDNLFSVKDDVDSNGILATTLGFNSVVTSAPIILYFDGLVTSPTILLLNKLNKRTYPLYFRKERLSLGENVKILLETPDLTNKDLSQMHNVSVVRLEDYFLKDFELLESRLEEFWEPDKFFHEFLYKSKKHLAQFLEICVELCDPMIVSDTITIETCFLNLFQGILKTVFEEDTQWKTNSKCISKLSFFCSLWAVFPTISKKEQKEVDDYLRKSGSDVPVFGTVFDFYIDKENLEWEHWRKNIKEWKYDPNFPHSSIYIQTIDYLRCQYFFNVLLRQGRNVLLVGPKGSGKSSIIKEFLMNFEQSNYHMISIQVCHNTTPNQIFESIVKFTEKKSKHEVQPIGGKKLLLYLDDINLDEKSALSEALKFFWENRFWIVDGKKVHISDVVVLATETMDMGSRPRYISSSRKCFQCLNLDEVSETDITNIYQTILRGKFLDFEVNIKFLTLSIVKGTIGTFNTIKEWFQEKNIISTMFTLNDIKKVICGVLRSHKDCHDTKFEVVQLWVNEILRTFRDRMMDIEAEDEVVEIVRKQTKKVFNLSFDDVCEYEEINEPPRFGNILDTYGFYTDLDDDELLEYLNNKVEEYNADEENPKLTLIFNDFIIQNILKILRVISEPEGHIIMSGETGKCRQSIIRLSAQIYNMVTIILGERDVTEYEIWKESMRTLIRSAGIEDKPTLLYVALGESECSEFLRTLSSMLSFGIDATMFEKNEISAIEKRKKSKDGSENLRFSKIASNVLKNLHVVFSVDLSIPKVASYFKDFTFLLSKVVINHIKEIKLQDYQQMVEIFLSSTFEHENFKLPSQLDIVLSSVFIESKNKIMQCMRANVLNSSSFHSFLCTLIRILNLKLGERILVQKKYEQIFENLEKLCIYTEELKAEVAEAKKNLNESQKVQDELQIQKMQVKRDFEDIQKKLSDEQKKAQDEKINLAQLELSLKTEIEELWSPVERSKLQLNELNDIDIQDFFQNEYPESKLAFIKSVSIIFENEQEIDEKILNNLIKEMVNIKDANLTDAKLSRFMEYLAKNKPKQEILMMVEEDFIMESIKLWCISIEAFGKGRKSSNQKKQKSEQIKKRFESRQNSIQEIKQQSISLDTDLDIIDENSTAQLANIDSEIKHIEEIESRTEKAEKVKKFLESDIDKFKAMHQEFESDKNRILGNSILSGAFLSFYPPFNSTQRKEIMQVWKDYLEDNEISFDKDIDIIEYLHGKAKKNQFISKTITLSDILLENNFILQSRKKENVVICVDPDDQAVQILSQVQPKTPVIVTHIDDQYLRKNVIQTLARGETLIVRNAEQRYENLVLPLTRKIFKKEGDTVYIKVFGNLCHFDPNFQVRILISDMKDAKIASDVVVMNFKHCYADYEKLFFTMISLKKANVIHNQKIDTLSKIGSSVETVKQFKTSLLEVLSSPLDKLLNDEKLIDNVNDMQEIIRSTEERMDTYSGNYASAFESLAGFKPLATFCAQLFVDIRRIRLINPVYRISLNSFYKFIDIREEEEGEDDADSEPSESHGLLQLSDDEMKILTNLLSKCQIMMTTPHFSVAILKLGISIAIQKNVVTESFVHQFEEHILKVSNTSGPIDNKQSLLTPFLSEAEGKVISAVVETADDPDNIFGDLQQIPELNFLQLMGVICVHLKSRVHESIYTIMCQLLDIKLPGIIILCQFFNQ